MLCWALEICVIINIVCVLTIDMKIFNFTCNEGQAGPVSNMGVGIALPAIVDIPERCDDTKLITLLTTVTIIMVIIIFVKIKHKCRVDDCN